MVENYTKPTKAMKLPPQSLDAEEYVLGSLLVNPMVSTRIIDSLTPKSFYNPSNGEIYAAIFSLLSSDKPIDVYTVSEELKSRGKLDTIGGRERINDLALQVVTTANVEYYANLINEKATMRELINAGSEIVEIAYEESSPEVALDVAEHAIFSIAQKKSKSDLTEIKDLLQGTFDQIEFRYNNREDLTGVTTGFYDLDKITAGLQKSDLIILAARPSMGKTAFALNIAQNVAKKEKVPVAIFSLEMPKNQITMRMLGSEAEIDANKLRTGHMQTEDWVKLSEAMGTLAEAPIFIDDTSGATIMDIRTKCRRLAMQHGSLGLVVVDYLQLMEGSTKSNGDRNQEISAISRGLKSIARELSVPIIALSQLSRQVENRADKTPMLSDLRESGAIEQDADIVMFIYREEYYDRENVESRGKAKISIAKHRNGPTGEVELLFQSNITKFKNRTTKTDVF